MSARLIERADVFETQGRGGIGIRGGCAMLQHCTRPPVRWLESCTTMQVRILPPRSDHDKVSANVVGTAVQLCAAHSGTRLASRRPRQSRQCVRAAASLIDDCHGQSILCRDRLRSRCIAVSIQILPRIVRREAIRIGTAAAEETVPCRAMSADIPPAPALPPVSELPSKSCSMLRTVGGADFRQSSACALSSASNCLSPIEMAANAEAESPRGDSSSL